MGNKNDRFWAKVLFKEFIRHFRKLNDGEIVNDIKQSMDDLDDLNDSGTSFGSKMVRWSMERAEEPRAKTSRENGAKGGRPPKLQPTSRIPENFDTVIDWCVEHGHDVDDARQIWDMTLERGGHDADGNKIENWWGYLVQCLKTKKENRK